jgi:4-aminobutyrate aminotransferase/(S)-3-amino-2-methylpropionate transaminase
VINRDKLVDLNLETGRFLLDGLRASCKQYPHMIGNARGLGTFCAFDAHDSQTRDKLVLKLKNLGIQCGASGDLAVRIRPSLVFTKDHASLFLDRLNQALRSF